MKTVLVLSFDEHVGDEARRALVADACRAVSAVAEVPAIELTSAERAAPRPGVPDEVVVVAGFDTSDAYESGTGRLAVLLARGAYTTTGARMDGSELLVRLDSTGDEILALAAPPFGVVFRRARGHPVEFATDACGLRHLYTMERQGWVAASSSSLALALLAGALLDETALGALALTGNLHADRTPFRDVRKIGHAQCAALAAGRIRRRSLSREDMDPPKGATSELIEEGARTLRALVDAALASHDDDPTLELSGGIDSRALLAAIPPHVRPRLRTVTLGTRSSPDVVVARGIAERHGIAHEIVDLAGIGEMDSSDAAALVGRAARLYDASAGAVANGVLLWVEAQVQQGPRFNGINGEYARGRFYSGQRGGRRSDKRVAGLVRWRVFANDAVDPGIFARDFIETARDDTVAAIQAEFRSYPTDWLRATDDHFLYGRMQRWCGIEFSTSCLDRAILAPFFCPPFLEWSRRLDAGQKRQSRTFAAVIQRMDPELARIPLVSGITPSGLAIRSPSVQVRIAKQASQKVAQKIRQRVAPGTDSPPAGAHRLAQLVQEHWAAMPNVLAAVSRLSILDPETVEAIALGTRPASAATVGFLTNLTVLADVAGAAATSSRHAT